MTHDPYRPPSADVGSVALDPDRLAVGDALSLSGRTWLAALPFVLGMALVVGTLTQLPTLLGAGSGRPDDPVAALVNVLAGVGIGVVVGPFTTGVYAWVCRRLYGGQPAPLGEAIRYGASRYGRVFVVNLGYTVAVTLGTMACLVPGVVLSVLMGPMVLSAALSPPGTSDANRGWAVGRAHFWTIAIALTAAWMPTMLLSGGVGAVGGAMAVTGQTVPTWVSLAGGIVGAVAGPLVITTLAAVWVLADREPA